MSEQIPAAACRMAEPIFRAPDTLVKISPSDALARRALSWPGMAVETAEVTQPCRIEVRFCAPVHLLVLFEEGVRRKGLSCIEGRPRSGLRNLKGKLVFVPSGHEYYDWQEPSRLSRAAYFYFDPAVLPSKSEAGHAAALLAPRLFFEDAGVWNIAIRLKALIEGGGPVDRLYCESLGVVLAHELARLGSGGARVEPAVRGGLAGWQQRAVSNYIEEHIADEIPLATMAQLARLSPITFAGRSSRHSAFRSIDSTCAVASNALRHCCGVPWPRSPRSAWPWVLRSKRILDGVSKGHRRDPEWLSAKRLTSPPVSMGSGLKREHHRAQRVQLRPRGGSCSQSFDLRHLRMKRETTRMKPVVTSGQNAAEP